jgi:hypothetical protein
MSDDEAPRPWRWRNCRSLFVGVGFTLLPWDWFRLRAWSTCDGGDHVGGCYGKQWGLVLGPISLSIGAGIGNNSTGDWRARFGLSEEEAWDRSK